MSRPSLQSLPYSKALVIIPTYNERENVSRMVQSIFDLYPQISLLIIDDGSPDGTANVVKSLQQQFPKLHLVERSGKLGLGTAYIAGFKWALARDYEFIFEMDCDFSHDPQDVQNLLAAATNGADLAIGSRYINGIRVINWPFRRLILSVGAGIYTRLITGMPVQDATGGFKCFRRETLAAINLNNVFSNGYSFQIELNYKVWNLGKKVQEVPIIFYERRDGQSKMGWAIIREAVFAVFKLRLRKIFNCL